MATIANIDVALRAQTAGFTRGMRGAKKELEGFRGAVTSVISSVKILAGAAGIGALVRSFSTATAAIGKFAEQSKRLSVSVAELQAIERVAATADISFESMAAGIAKFSENLKKAADGGKKMNAVLTELGLSASELHRAGLGESFQQVIGAINRLPSEDRIAAARQLFGKGGVQMLSLGPGDLKTAEADLRRLGLTMTNDFVKRTDDALDSYENFVNGIKNAWRKAVGYTVLGAQWYNAQWTAKAMADRASAASAPQGVHSRVIAARQAQARAQQNMQMGTAQIGAIASMFSEENVRAAQFQIEQAGRSAADMFLDGAMRKAREINKGMPFLNMLFGGGDYFAGKSGGRFGFFGKVAENVISEINASMRSSAERLRLETGTPLSGIESRMAELKRVRDRLSPGEYARAALQIRDDIASALTAAANNTRQPVFAPAAQFGSMAAFEARASFLRGENDTETIKKTLGDMLRELKEQTRLQQKEAEQALDELEGAGF